MTPAAKLRQQDLREDGQMDGPGLEGTGCGELSSDRVPSGGHAVGVLRKQWSGTG